MTNDLLLTKNQTRLIESKIYSEQIDSEFGLMTKAGQAAFHSMQGAWPMAKSILVIAGKGNNAGDGLVLAKLAKEAGLSVQILSVIPHEAYRGPAKQAAEECQSHNISFDLYESQPLDFDHYDVLIDALLGIGISGPVNPPYDSLIEQINSSEKPILSLDIPSGLDADTGTADNAVINASKTITFIGLKPGLLTNSGPNHSGELVYDRLQLPNTLFSSFKPSIELLNWQKLKQLLPKRERDAHKGKFGHVLIIGGDYGMGGAVRMSAEGALRVGAGLVTVATRREHVPIVSTNRPEIMCYQVADPADVKPLLEKASVVVIGPGLGKTEWAEMLLEEVLNYSCPKLLDADALNLLSKKSFSSNDWVLTPHPGEAAALLESDSKTVQENRFEAIKKLQDKYKGVIVLKGTGTLIKAQDELIKLCAAGNPGMASGGMGDVLSGVIGGLLAQGLNLSDAAELGVMAHAMAADAAAYQGGERGLLASDLMDHLRHLVNSNE